MSDFASMTDEELNRAAAEAAEPEPQWERGAKAISRGRWWWRRLDGRITPEVYPVTSLDDVKRLAEALGIILELRIFPGALSTAIAWPSHMTLNHQSAHDPSPARAATIAILTVNEKRKEQT
jgi:hypothetical protein